MRLGKDLQGKIVVTIEDGRNVGKVKDVYLTSDLSAMSGVHLGSEGVLRRKARLIPVNDVVVFGIDAILIQTADVITDSKTDKDAATWVRLSKLDGRSVDTPGGTRVGTIGDVVLDEGGQIAGFALSKTFVEGPIADKRIIYRPAVIDFGSDSDALTIELERAEKLEAGSPLVSMPDETAAGSKGISADSKT